MHFQCRSFIGRTSDTSWSQFWENEPDDRNVFALKGHLFGLISLTSSTSPTSLTQLGHDLIESITNNYYSSEFTSISTNLTNAVDSLSLPQDTRFTIIVAVVHQNKLFTTITGSGAVHLVRSGKIANIIENYGHEAKIISGPLQDSDSILLTTNDFIKEITWDALKIALDSTKIQSIEENLLSLLYSSSAEAESSAALIQAFDDDDLPQKQIESQTIPQTIVPPFPISPSPIAPSPIPIIHTPTLGSKKTLQSLLSHLRPQSSDTINPSTLQTVSRRRKYNRIIAVVLLLALSFSVYFGYQKRLETQKNNQFDTLRQSLEAKLTDANTIRSLDLNSAKDLATQSQEILDQMKNIGLSTDLGDYQSQISQLLSQTGSSTVESATAFFELNLITDNPNYSQIALNGNDLYLLDSSKSHLDTLNLSQKSHQNYSNDPSISNLTHIVSDQSGIYGLSSSDIQLISSSKLTEKFKLSSIADHSSIQDMAIWNGSLYLLDTNTIWKLTPNSSGFSSQNWIQDDKDFPSNVSSIAINGKIWTLTSDAKITPYLRGQADQFKQPTDVTTSTAKGLITTAESELLAFFDDSNIVYVYGKDGSSKARYNLNDKKILDMTFSPDASKIYLLCQDQKLYLLNL